MVHGTSFIVTEWPDEEGIEALILDQRVKGSRRKIESIEDLEIYKRA
jgi:hypothetical protein